MPSTLFRGADVIDGTGSPRLQRDVLVRDGVITSIVEPGAVPGADRIIDASPGQVLSPGFIDMHAHSDLRLLTDPDHFPKISQGVTTEVIGQDGIAYAPIDDADSDDPRVVDLVHTFF
ncbi:amidohydrolase family protein [Rhodococcoides fascians A21d2]|uniref:amidohydrolase family protein n=1 Tax=Rhodococcoides fascians TaxID=1828 RepID=UPI0013EF3FE2|nr:amidohydrolase family protein [Rhodococcus fascians]QII01978.1 amidohydrolase family protein [Rhodococcus fascians A21d2]